MLFIVILTIVEQGVQGHRFAFEFAALCGLVRKDENTRLGVFGQCVMSLQGRFLLLLLALLYNASIVTPMQTNTLGNVTELTWVTGCITFG